MNRKWWIISNSLVSGSIGNTYHYLDFKKNATACGISLPDYYGRFYRCADTQSEQIKKRCANCSFVKRKESILIDKK
jgi:hypothetical protein